MDCSADEMDEATLQLVLQLQQADLKELQDEAKEWNNKDGLLRDADLAFEMYQEELSSLETFATARQLGQRLNEEEEADEKKEAAEGEDELGETENRWWETFMPARFARWRGEIRREKCDMCTDEYPQTYLFQTTCNHKYCPGCIIDLFEASINDESLFPPRCCGNVFSAAEHEHVLGYELLERWRVKEVEYTTPNRTYCHVPTCSAFIPPSRIDGDVGYCPVDCHSTCTLCKGPAHPHHACEQDQATQEFLRIAAENNWQRCTHCQAIVELNQGCYHITCRCRNEFCYLCLAEWKTCDCVHWSEERLLAAGEERVDRDAHGEDYNAEERRAAVERAREEIRENHDVDNVGSSLAADADTIVSKAR
ncbi:hypothetical protein COL922a_007299 [Colletotrichum nupharicola]|nr:hypothetical protein COL922a_007299 [Colletotrichum nupharicola]